jgi:hypothetical protein
LLSFPLSRDQLPVKPLLTQQIAVTSKQLICTTLGYPVLLRQAQNTGKKVPPSAARQRRFGVRKLACALKLRGIIQGGGKPPRSIARDSSLLKFDRWRFSCNNRAAGALCG